VKSEKKWLLKREPNRITLSQEEQKPPPEVTPRRTLQSILKAWFH